MDLSSSIYENKLEEYKECAGKDCHRLGTHFLKVRFVNRQGWFCDLCKDKLLLEDLVIVEESMTGVRRYNKNDS
jgi:hypothetical protein